MIRPASTLCLLRPGPDTLEVAMVRRSGGSVFVGGAHVFPGGAVEEIDRSELAHRAVAGVEDEDLFPWVAAAVREAAEEAGVVVAGTPATGLEGLHGPAFYRALVDRNLTLDGGRLVHLWTWVTPPGQPRRFDTRFFVVTVDVATTLRADGREVTEAVWVTPRQALQRAGAGEWLMIPPTLETLKLLDRFDHPSQVVAYATSQEVVPRIEPRLLHGPPPIILFPGDPGYEEAVRG